MSSPNPIPWALAIALPARGSCIEPADDCVRWFSEEVQPYEAKLRAYLRHRFPTLRATTRAPGHGWRIQRHRAFLLTRPSPLAGNRKYKMNLCAAYSFSEGALRGLRVGGGYRHQSKLPIGQYADKRLQYGPSWWDSNAMIGYRFARSTLPWLKRLSVQLNVNNMFNEDDAYVLRRVQDTNPETVRRLRVREPRTWRLTTSFDF